MKNIMIKIRKFQEEDAEQASNLIKRALIEVNSRDYSQKVINNLCNLFSPQNLIQMAISHNILVAVKDDTVFGTVRLKQNAIFTMFVDPDYHHQGIGAKLMEAVESLAKSKGYDEVKLAASLTAIKFYEKLEYTNTQETYEDEYGLTYIMKKNLEGIKND